MKILKFCEKFFLNREIYRRYGRKCKVWFKLTRIMRLGFASDKPLENPDRPTSIAIVTWLLGKRILVLTLR